jgi:hypothetical protein
MAQVCKNYAWAITELIMKTINKKLKKIKTLLNECIENGIAFRSDIPAQLHIALNDFDEQLRRYLNES